MDKKELYDKALKVYPFKELELITQADREVIEALYDLDYLCDFGNADEANDVVKRFLDDYEKNLSTDH